MPFKDQALGVKDGVENKITFLAWTFKLKGKGNGNIFPPLRVNVKRIEKL